MGIIYHEKECTCFGSKAILHVAYLLLNNLFSQLWAPYVVIYLERIALIRQSTRMSATQSIALSNGVHCPNTMALTLSKTIRALGHIFFCRYRLLV